jgi:hypothetical protein
MCKRISGRMRETKITNMELNWLYSALPGSQSTPLTLWSTGGVVKQHRIRDIGSGCYLFILAIPLRPGITRNPKHLLAGTSLDLIIWRKGKYISEDERGGFKVAKVNFPLSDGRFLEGK